MLAPEKLGLRAQRQTRALAGYLFWSRAKLQYIYIKNLDILFRLLFINPSVLDFVNDIQPLYCPSEYGVLIVKPWLPGASVSSFASREVLTYSLFRGNKELASIRVRSRIRHAKCVWFIVLQATELILEFLTPDTLTPSTVT
jgi:hypothetical protein